MLFPMLRRPSTWSNGPRTFFADFERMQRDLNKLFATSVAVAPTGLPAIEFFKGDEGFIVRANVPGYSADSLDISLQGKKLVIKGDYAGENEGEEDEATAVVRERRTGSFSRTLTLPQNIDSDNVSASFDNGVVEIRLPLAASEQPRRIEIGASQ